VKNFDDMLAKDREFTVGGETFHWRDVRPEVLTSFEPSTNGDGKNEDGTDKEPDDNAAWRLMDDQILLFIAKDEADRWRELRSRDDNPVTIAQLNAILLWLMEEQTGRPTVQPSPSEVGRGRTAATSKAG
jgi:hypothetical protein